MVEGVGLEHQYSRKIIESSNLSLSAMKYNYFDFMASHIKYTEQMRVVTQKLNVVYTSEASHK